MALKRSKLKEKQDAARVKREGKKKVKTVKKDGEGGEFMNLLGKFLEWFLKWEYKFTLSD